MGLPPAVEWGAPHIAQVREARRKRAEAAKTAEGAFLAGGSGDSAALPPAASGPSRLAATAVDGDGSDSDDVVITKELDLDAMLEVRMCSGAQAGPAQRLHGMANRGCHCTPPEMLLYTLRKLHACYTLGAHSDGSISTMSPDWPMPLPSCP